MSTAALEQNVRGEDADDNSFYCKQEWFRRQAEVHVLIVYDLGRTTVPKLQQAGFEAACPKSGSQQAL